MHPAGIELTTSRLRQHRQLPVVQNVRCMPLQLCKKQKTNPMTCPSLHWTTDNPSGMHRCQFQQPCVLINTRHYGYHRQAHKQLAQKHQLKNNPTWKNVGRWNFPGSYLDAHWASWYKFPQNLHRGIFIKMDVVASTWPLLEPKNAVTFYTFDSKTIWYVYPCFQRQSDITHNPTCENQIYDSNSIANALELVLHKALKICLSLHREFQYSNVALLAQ